MGHGKFQFSNASMGSLLLHLLAALVVWQFVLLAKVQLSLLPPSGASAVSTANNHTGGIKLTQLRLPPQVRAAHAFGRNPNRFYDPGVAMFAEGLDAESRYLSAIALEECYALSHDGIARFRDDFAHRLNSPTDIADQNQISAREGAFNRSYRDCVLFDGLPISPNYILGLLKSAAHDGDPGAIARTLLFRDLADSKVGSFDVIARLLSTGDPHVIRDVGLFLTRGESTLILGDGATPVRATTLAVAWELVACDFGLDCSGDTKLIYNLCAYQAQCGAISYEDWLFRYSESPEELSEILRLRTLLRRGLMFHDWHLLGLLALTLPTAP